MPTLRTSALDRIYARSLLALAQESGQLDAIEAQCVELSRWLNEHPQAMSLLSNQMLGVAERAGTVERLFRGRVSDLLLRFLLVMNRKGRLDRLQGVLDAFGHELLAIRGIVEVEAHVATPLDPSQAQAVAQRLSATLGREVLLHQKLDPELIGGIKLRIGDRLVDGSVAAQLRQLRNRLSKVRG